MSHLLPCPCCHRKVARSAAVCPRCGATLETGWQRQAQQQFDDRLAKDERRKRIVWYIALGIAAYVATHQMLDQLAGR